MSPLLASFMTPSSDMPSHKLPPRSSPSASILSYVQTIPGAVREEVPALRIASRQVLDQALRGRDPEPMLGRLEELRHPLRREVGRRESPIDNGRLVRVAGSEAKESEISGSSPQPAFVILEQRLEKNSWEPVASAVPRRRAISPSTIQAVLGRNPQRPASILEQIGDDPLLHVVVWNANRDRVKRLAAPVRLESEQAIGRPYPDRAVAALAKHGDHHDQLGVAGRRDRPEHRRPPRSSSSSPGVLLCEAHGVEAHESSPGADPGTRRCGFPESP